MATPRFLEHLGDELVLRLVEVRPEVRQMVEHLVSKNAVARMMGLDAIYGCTLDEGRPRKTATDALPFLFALASAPGYPHASGILGKLAVVLDTLDHPPRRLADASRRGDLRVDAVWRAYEDHTSALLRVARSSRDPESSRGAVHILVHFPALDAELEPALFALLSGAPDAEARSRLLYALAHVQYAQRRPMHREVVHALALERPRPESAAVAFALVDAGVEGALRRQVREALVRLAANVDLTPGWADPRAWDTRFDPEAIDEALVGLDDAR